VNLPPEATRWRSWTEHLISRCPVPSRPLPLAGATAARAVAKPWHFRKGAIVNGALARLFNRLDEATTGAGYLPMAGPIFEATLVSAPHKRNKNIGKARIEVGEAVAAIWPDEAAKARQKDTEGWGPPKAIFCCCPWHGWLFLGFGRSEYPLSPLRLAVRSLPDDSLGEVVSVLLRRWPTSSR